MTDEPSLPPGPDDDVTAAEARRLEALFGDLVADEPPTTVTPTTVLSEVRRLARTSDPADGRSATRSSGPTARRLRIGVLVAAVVAVLVTGTVLIVNSRPGDTSAAVGTPAAGSTIAGTSAGSAAGGSSAAGSTAAGSSTAESSAAMESSAAGATTTAAASQSGSMAPSPGSSTDASSSGMSSAASSGTSTPSPAPGTCALTAALPRLRAVLRGTALEGARISLCRNPASLSADSRVLLVNVRSAPGAACVRSRPACRAVVGASDAWISSSAEGFRVWLYDRDYEVSVLSVDRPSDPELDALVAALRPLPAALP